MRYHIKTLLTAIAIVVIQLLPSDLLYAQWGFKVGEESKIPTADKWEFVKQGEVGASLHTGTVNLSIPVYLYQDHDFTLPLTLNYTSNGLVANLRPGILGPDWTLSAGGSISVEIRGISDLNQDVDYAESYYRFHQLTNPGTEGSYWRYSSYPDQNIELGAPAPEIIYIPDSSIGLTTTTTKYDAEPDIFHFHFMGYSGTFHLGPNGNIYVYNTDGDNKLHKIEITEGNTDKDITITDKYGYKYEFLHVDRDCGSNRQGATNLGLSYNLSSITAPNGRVLSFEYSSYDMTTYRPAAFASTGSVIDLSSENALVSNNTNYNDLRILETTLDSKILTQIYVDSQQIAEFTYTDYTSGTKDQYKANVGSTLSEFTECKRLSGIKILNPHSTDRPVIKEVSLKYLTTTTPRTHYLDTLTISGEGSYSFSYYGMSDRTFPPIGTLSVDHWGYYNGKTSSAFLKIVSTNSSTLDETITSTSRNPDATYAIRGMLQRIIYPTGGYSEMEYEAHNYGKMFRRNSSNHFSPTLVNETGICGGLRLKSIHHYDVGGVLLNSKTYSYTLADGTSSGILLYFPKYWLTYSAQGGPYQEININYWSNNLLSYSGSHIEYSTVTQTNSDNSREVFHFSNSSLSFKYRDALEIGDVVNEKVANTGDEWGITSNNAIRNIVAPLVSKRAERGKLLKHEIYASGSNTPSKEIIYGYDTTRALSSVSYPVYLIRKFGQVPVYTDNYRLISKTEKETNTGTVISRIESYSYNSKGQLSGITTQSSVGNTEITRYTYPYDHLSEGGIFTTMNSQNLYGLPVTETRYVVEGGVERQIGGKKYSYTTFNSLIKPSVLYNYNPVTGAWDIEQRYTKYDSKGNLQESYDSNDIPTSYVWGYGGMYLVGKAENVTNNTLSGYVSTGTPLSGELPDATAATINSSGNILLTTYHYNPLVGLQKVRYPDGTIETYHYNSTGKLLHMLDHSGNRTGSYYYSPDNGAQ